MTEHNPSHYPAKFYTAFSEEYIRSAVRVARWMQDEGLDDVVTGVRVENSDHGWISYLESRKDDKVTLRQINWGEPNKVPLDYTQDIALRDLRPFEGPLDRQLERAGSLAFLLRRTVETAPFQHEVVLESSPSQGIETRRIVQEDIAD